MFRDRPPYLTRKQELRIMWPCYLSAIVFLGAYFLFPQWAARPYLIVATLLSVLAGNVFIFRHKWQVWRRWAQGRCLKCGYDLRASPDRCPECGTVPAAETTK